MAEFEVKEEGVCRFVSLYSLIQRNYSAGRYSDPFKLH